MRDADRAEVRALGHTPKQALRLALVGSSWAVTAMINGSPHGMFGVTPVAPWKGEPWFLGTNLIYQERRAMLVLGQRAVDQMQAQFSKLGNVVSVHNERAIRLLERWGFTVGADVQVIGDLEFRQFWRAR
jgi:hypothetical protein